MTKNQSSSRGTADPASSEAASGPLKKRSLEDLKHEYTEACNNHRHYSALRFASLTLYFAIIGAIASVTIGLVESSDTVIETRLWSTVAGLVVTPVFFFFEALNDRNLRHFVSVLKGLESDLGYTQMTTKQRHPAMRARHATYPLFILLLLFWIYAFFQAI